MRWVWLWSSWIFEPASYPVDTRREAGFQLDKVQRGLEPDDWKPMNIVGPGVREIRIFETTGIFRVMYVANIGESIYVLHAFESPREFRRLVSLSQAALHDPSCCA